MMDGEQQERIYDMVRDRPIREFGWRELGIIYGGNWEIEKTSCKNRLTYKLTTDDGTCKFNFGEDGAINFVG